MAFRFAKDGNGGRFSPKIAEAELTFEGSVIRRHYKGQTLRIILNPFGFSVAGRINPSYARTTAKSNSIQ